MHLSGLRPIRDDHLNLYITALDKAEQSAASGYEDTTDPERKGNAKDKPTEPAV